MNNAIVAGAGEKHLRRRQAISLRKSRNISARTKDFGRRAQNYLVDSESSLSFLIEYVWIVEIYNIIRDIETSAVTDNLGWNGRELYM